jgi:hypothetical protein
LIFSICVERPIEKSLARNLLIEKDMKGSVRKAFIMDHDEFVRLSLNKILKSMIQAEEIEDFSSQRVQGDRGGMILADVGHQDLERWSLF